MKLPEGSRWVFKLSDYQSDIAKYEEHLKLNPNDSDIWLKLGLIYERMGELDDASNCYKKANKIKPNPNTLMNLSTIYVYKSDFEKAHECVLKAIKLDPENSELWLNLGISYKQRNNLDEAIRSFEKNIKLNPQSREGWAEMGYIHFNNKSYTNLDKLIENYEKQNENDTHLRHLFAMQFHINGESKKAQNYFEKIISIKPEDPLAWFNLGLVNYKQKNIEKAEKCYQKALSLKGDKTYNFGWYADFV